MLLLVSFICLRSSWLLVPCARLCCFWMHIKTLHCIILLSYQFTMHFAEWLLLLLLASDISCLQWLSCCIVTMLSFVGCRFSREVCWSAGIRDINSKVDHSAIYLTAARTSAHHSVWTKWHRQNLSHSETCWLYCLFVSRHGWTTTGWIWVWLYQLT